MRTVIAASAGNHGRAVARAAALRGLTCRVYLPSRSLDARRAAIVAEGAEVVVVDGTDEDAVAAAERAAIGDGVALITDVGDRAPAGGWSTALPRSSRTRVLLIASERRTASRFV
jgi:diaminopropionate ammonia-lyase